MSAGIMLGRAQCVYMIAVVSLQGPASVVGKGRTWSLERWAWGRPFLATLRVSVLNGVNGEPLTNRTKKSSIGDLF